MMDSDLFMSYSLEVYQGVSIIVLSITSDKQSFPEGIYLLTNIDSSNVSNLANIIRPMMDPIRKAIMSEPDSNDQVYDVPQEFDNEMSQKGAKINMANTIGVAVVGITKTGGVIFSLHTQSFQQLRDNFKPSNI